MAFTVGQRVRTTVNAPTAWDGAFGAPVGTLGTIDSGPDKFGSYGVLLDGDPNQMPASYHGNELTSA
ncbi:hypothetical protein [Streptomyces sp. NPDC056549]|uniref:hypothetical protein n=1 Tax=Streptomyces sp. NPDC056549 TaxID=3345864 RepID=UPI0036B3AE4C